MTRPVHLVALALAFTSLAAPAATAADRPFKGHASGVIQAFPDPIAGTPGVVQYTGQATHLGRFTRTEYFNFDGFGGIFGTMFFTAANGDQLYVDFDGQFTSLSTAEGTYEFNGGTGRFHDAAGTADFRAVLGPEGRVEVDFAGSIRY